MKLFDTGRHVGRFDLLAITTGLQAAMMTLWAHEASDDEHSNEHPRSEQWLFVMAGTGTATVIPPGGRRRSVKVRPGILLVIERNERHQIKNSGRGALRTINFYVPPAYRADGSVRRAAKR